MGKVSFYLHLKRASSTGILAAMLNICLRACFEKNHEFGASKYRGNSGYLQVSRGTSRDPLYDAFIEAGRQAGYPLTDDFNGVQQEGFGRYDFTIFKGQRSRLDLFLNDNLYSNQLWCIITFPEKTLNIDELTFANCHKAVHITNSRLQHSCGNLEVCGSS